MNAKCRGNGMKRRPMRVLPTMQLAYTRAYGGATQSNRYICEGFVEKDHSVRAVTVAIDKNRTEALFQQEFTHLSVQAYLDDEASVFE